MKLRVIILVFLLLFSSNVLGIVVTLSVGENHVRNGVNITFTKLDLENERVILCVNNQKRIINEDKLTYFSENGTNFVELEVDHINKKDKTIDIDIGWTNVCGEPYCECVGNCLNDLCVIEREEVEEEENKTVEIKEIEILKREKTDYNLAVVFGIFGGLIGIFLVWLFWLREVAF